MCANCWRRRARPGLGDADRAAIRATATDLVPGPRPRRRPGAIEAFMRQYDLGSEEGVLLMCVAEAPAADPRPGHGRPADPRQARRGRLAPPRGSLGLGAGERLDLGPDAHRSPGGPGRGDPARRARRAPAPGRARGRAGGAAGRAPGDADHGPPVRHGAHDWRRPGAQPQGRQRQVPLFIRHARRGGDDRAGRGPLLDAYGDAIDAIGATGPFADEITAPSIRSSCRPCTRATSTPSAPGCWPNWPRTCCGWPARPRATTSA